MLHLRWDPAKSEQLKRARGHSFEEVLRGKLIAVREHPSRSRQSVMLFELEGYVWVVPYVANGDERFLKTLFASRKYTRKWKMGESL